MFWVENPQGRAPGCLDCVDPATALHGGMSSRIGPVFDSLRALVICEDSEVNSTAQPTTAYPDTTGLGAALFTGAAKFTPEDYEVWAAT